MAVHSWRIVVNIYRPSAEAAFGALFLKLTLSINIRIVITVGVYNGFDLNSGNMAEWYNKFNLESVLSLEHKRINILFLLGSSFSWSIKQCTLFPLYEN